MRWPSLLLISLLFSYNSMVHASYTRGWMVDIIRAQDWAEATSFLEHPSLNLLETPEGEPSLLMVAMVPTFLSPPDVGFEIPASVVEFSVAQRAFIRALVRKEPKLLNQPSHYIYGQHPLYTLAVMAMRLNDQIGDDSLSTPFMEKFKFVVDLMEQQSKQISEMVPVQDETADPRDRVDLMLLLADTLSIQALEVLQKKGHLSPLAPFLTEEYEPGHIQPTGWLRSIFQTMVFRLVEISVQYPELVSQSLYERIQRFLKTQIPPRNHTEFVRVAQMFPYLIDNLLWQRLPLGAQKIQGSLYILDNLFEVFIAGGISLNVGYNFERGYTSPLMYALQSFDLGLAERLMTAGAVPRPLELSKYNSLSFVGALLRRNEKWLGSAQSALMKPDLLNAPIQFKEVPLAYGQRPLALATLSVLFEPDIEKVLGWIYFLIRKGANPFAEGGSLVFKDLVAFFDEVSVHLIDHQFTEPKKEIVRIQLRKLEQELHSDKFKRQARALYHEHQQESIRRQQGVSNFLKSLGGNGPDDSCGIFPNSKQ